MNYLLKNGLYALMCLTILSSCSKDDDEDPAVIGAITITTATSGDGTILSVTPTASGATSFSVDFGTDATDDVKTTAGPAVTYDYPNNATATEYTVTVTASATGSANKTEIKKVTITLVLSDAVGDWVLLHEAGALAVGPTADDLSWWSSTIATVGKRDCLFDDIYKLNADGSFLNVIGTETWLEPYSNSASPEECGTATSPYDGTATATWAYDQTKGTIIITGKGAYLGIPKAFNGGEFDADGTDFPAVGENEITYTSVTFSEDKKTMTMKINYTLGFWQFKFAKVGSAGASSPTTDTDGDGVLDINDACADTPSGATIDSTGCPIITTTTRSNAMDDFEGTNGNVVWTPDGGTTLDASFINPSKTGDNTSNTVLKYVDDGSNEYANIRFDLMADHSQKFDLTTKHVFKVKVYVPTPDPVYAQTLQLALKLQDGSAAKPWEGQAEVIQTYVYDSWQELTFDFTDQAAETKYSRIVVQFNSEDNTEVVVGYIDDITQTE